LPVRDVLRYPHPALKRVARELDSSELELMRSVGADLVDTMRSFPGCVGIAAPQIDEAVRMIVVDCSEHKRAVNPNGLLVLVNPVISSSSGAEVAREGCLSIPDLTANVRRATEVVIEATDPEGERLSISSEGFEARCLLHEIDHLDGLLFLDRVDSLKTDVFKRKRYK
jgi:peptide deformylase